jgi:Uma2 family endonuclease
VAWISLPRWQQLTGEQQKTFPPLCPDFLIELRSESDSIAILKLKMEEYIDNGLRLGWLIDPQNHCVAIYRPSQDPQWLDHPQIINGETILPSFTFTVSKLWS